LNFCLELNINKAEKKISWLTKAPSEGSAKLLNDYIAEFLKVNEFIKE